MTAVPIWPGVTEYLYQAASSALVVRLGTCDRAVRVEPEVSSVDRTPIARDGDGHRDRATVSDGPLAAAGADRRPRPRMPGTARAAARARRRRWRRRRRGPGTTPAIPASLTRARPRGGGAGANWLSRPGHDHAQSGNSRPASQSLYLPGGRLRTSAYPSYVLAWYSSSVMSPWETRHCPAGPSAGTALPGCPECRTACRGSACRTMPGVQLGARYPFAALPRD